MERNTVYGPVLPDRVLRSLVGRETGGASPSVVFASALIASMAGLAYAMRALPVGAAYAVWVGIGAALTVRYSMATGEEPLSALGVVFLLMIIAGVLGLGLAR